MGRDVYSITDYNEEIFSVLSVDDLSNKTYFNYLTQ